MQFFTAQNPSKYATGRQNDVAIEIGNPTATSSTNFVSLSQFEVTNDPEVKMIEDAEGNRTTNTHSVIGERTYPFTFGGSTDINKIGQFIYLATGTVTSVQDAATGAYQHTFVPLNNVVLPQFTVFYSMGAEGYRRLTGGHIADLTVTVTDTECTFSGNGFATLEDDTENSSSSVSALTVTDVEYQTASGLTRYTFSGSPDLSTATNGDILNITAVAVTNASNRGKFIIVNVDDTNDFVEVINPNRADATDDETGITAAGNQVIIVTAPAYPEPEAIMLRRHSALRIAADTTGLNAATDDGMRNFTIEFNNNSAEIREKPKASGPLVVIGKNITVAVTFTQIMKQSNAVLANTIKEGESENRAFRIEMEDTSRFLGTSVSFRPMIRGEFPKALGIATRGNQHTNDELIYDWALSVQDEQATTFVIRNTVASYG